jgi:predicted HAD superfamily phosphohydrolase YqeG
MSLHLTQLESYEKSLASCNRVKENYKVIFFDFDGVIGVPWTHPESPFPNLSQNLQRLYDAGLKLCAVSYNPSVQVAINRWGMGHLFTAVRARSNQLWADPHDW